MAEISQKDQLALHEFSVRYRAGHAVAHKISDRSITTVQDAVREEYEREQDAKRDVAVEPPEPTPEREPEEPEP